jgi:hypothetical protein
VIYQYWIIRFVPDVARGEFANIGIVCGRDDGDWAVEFDTKSIRSRGHFSTDLRELSVWVSWFVRAVTGEDAGSGPPSVSSGWLEHLRSRQANSVQFAEPSPVEATTAREAVGILFPLLVARPPLRSHSQGLTRRRLRAQVRDLSSPSAASRSAETCSWSRDFGSASRMVPSTSSAATRVPTR